MKGKVGIVVLIGAVVGLALFWNMEREPYSREAVKDAVWDKFNVQGVMIEGIGEANPIFSVSVYDEKEINDVEDYIKNHLTKEDLEKFTLNVYEYSSDPYEELANSQENLN